MSTSLFWKIHALVYVIKEYSWTEIRGPKDDMNHDTFQEHLRFGANLSQLFCCH